MPVYKKEIRYIDTVKYKEFDTCVAVELNHHIKGNCGFFMSCKEWDDKSQEYNNNLIEVALNVKRPYVYHKQEFWKRFRKEGLTSQEGLRSFWNMQIKPFNAIKNKLFSPCDLVWIDRGSDLLYKLDAEYPMTQPYWVGYIGGLTNEYFDLEKAEKILRSNSNVWKIRKISIPYYNREDDCTHVVEFFTKIPQDIYDQVCKYWRDRDKYWTVRVKEMLPLKPWVAEAMEDAPFDPDILGLKEAWKKNNSSKCTCCCHEEDDDY
jgi:hypothetical protein